ncbi:hypothetical protein BMS3Bbin12_01923 [bacterium BMS3Bbin12]|nr:hypothetical protein BMS3Bbin12_01923 [bacterium BMS3Bbin12]
MNQQQRIVRDRLPVRVQQTKGESLEAYDVGMIDKGHEYAARRDAQQQDQHKVIGRGADVADTIDEKAPAPEPEQADHYAEGRVFPKRLHQHDPPPHRLREVPQMPECLEEQTEMEHPPEQPSPLVGFEQAREEYDLAPEPQHNARAGGRRGRCGNLQGCGRACVLNDLAAHADHQHEGGKVKEQGIRYAQKVHVCDLSGSDTKLGDDGARGRFSPPVPCIRRSPWASEGRRICRPASPGRKGTVRKGTCCCPCRRRASCRWPW